MKVAYFDCFSGAAGDMIVGALLDAGLDEAALRAELAKLNLPGYDLAVTKVRRGAVAGSHFQVRVHEHEHPHRHLSDILQIIDQANLRPRAAALARTMFERLGAAEAKVHGIEVEQVHFHEVGAVDSIVDIVASAIAIDLLDIEQVFCSAIPTGTGLVKMAHGLLPVPAPATAELLKNAATVGTFTPEAAKDQPTGELTTPTGAVVLTTLSQGYGPIPAMQVSAVGYGAGARENGILPNLLRVILGDMEPSGGADAVMELSANIDDSTGQILGSTLEKLLAAGCLDAWCAPVTMKKSRPGWTLSALCTPADVPRIERLLFSETTTIGIRRRLCARSKLQRDWMHVETPFGPVRVKVGRMSAEGPILSAVPEFADCAMAAERHGVAVKDVLTAAVVAFHTRGERPAGQ